MHSLERHHGRHNSGATPSSPSGDAATALTPGTVSFVPAEGLTGVTGEHAGTIANVSPTHITIIPTFDASVIDAGGTITAGFESAVNTAIQFWESEITNPITITIGFGWGENGGVAMPPASGASSDVTSSAVDWTSLYNAVQATDTTSAVQRDAAHLLTSADPTGGTGTFFISPAEQLALGLVDTVSSPVGTVGLSVDTYNWSETGPQNPAGSDAVSEFEHEISEVMGRTDDGGQGNDYTLLDMYRYTAANGQSGDPIGSAAGTIDQPFVTGYDPNASSYFSYNGTTVTLQYDTPAEVAGGADIADWTASVPNDSFDGSGGPGSIDPVSPTDLQEMNVLGYDLKPPCFLAGTRITTPGGEVAVETLLEGDLVTTISGAHRKLRWVGRGRTLVTPRNRDRATPVVVRKHALGEYVPRRDLYVTRGHSLLLEGVLIPVEELINHRTIAWVEAAQVVEYYHLELDSHDVVIADGAAAESYREDDNSPQFLNAATRPAAPPQPPYAPVLHDHPTVKHIWRKLSDRAGQPDLTLTDDPDLHLRADGVRLDAGTAEEGVWRFHLRGSVTELRIVSRSAIPSMTGIEQDQRRLGVAVRRIVVTQPGLQVAVDWDCQRLADGFHGPEPAERHRWTNGNAALPPSLLPLLQAGATVELHVNGKLAYPVQPAAELALSEAA
jgi:hypothetical protein